MLVVLHFPVMELQKGSFVADFACSAEQTVVVHRQIDQKVPAPAVAGLGMMVAGSDTGS